MADFTHLRFGFPAASFGSHGSIARRLSASQIAKRAPNPSCKTGGFITSPSQAQAVSFPGTSNLNITWDPSCLDTQLLDIYLYAFSGQSSSSSRSVSTRASVGESTSASASTRIHLYTAVPNSLTTYSAPIKPKWWLAANSSTSSPTTTSLQVMILPKDQAPFLSTLPAGPVFVATYTPPSGGSIPPEADPSIPDKDGGITNFAVTNNPDGSLKAVTSSGASANKVSPGGKAAAVIFPLLFVIGIGVGYWFWRKRRQSKEERKRFSEMVDKRMSVISKEWKPMSAKGAMEGVRASVYDGRNSFATLERGSVIGGGQAGVGAASRFNVDVAANPALAEFQSHLRHPVASTATGERKSRVSFAADTIDRKSRGSFADSSRPSMDRTSRYDGRPSTDRASRYGGVGYGGRASRAFHTALTVGNDGADEYPGHGSTSPVSRLTTTSNAASNGHGKDFHNAYPATNSSSPPVDDDDRDSSEEGSGTMSPTQAKGATSLSVEDIRKRIGGTSVGKSDTGALEGEVVPALKLMRTGSKQKSSGGNAAALEEGNDELLFSPSQFQFGNSNVVTVPSPTHAAGNGIVSPRSPGPVGMMPSMGSIAPTPETAMSPDALLRAYAERRATASATSASSPPIGGIRNGSNVPTPLTISAPISASTPYNAVSSPISAGGRTLYSPVTPGGSGGFAGVGAGRAAGAAQSISAASRKSASVYSVGVDEEDAYGGHA